MTGKDSSTDEIPLPGLETIEHSFEVPLDHSRPDGERISVFAREVAAPEGRERPLLLYLEGGPGFEAPRPTARPSSPGWLARALEDYRVLMLDQRGTGRSTPLAPAALGDREPRAQAEYLACLRGDSIVRDAEWIRRELGVERWSVLGQSFGGLCAVSYLSLAPEGLAEAFITGGLPPLGNRIDEVYELTYARVLERNQRYLARYPGDRRRLAALRHRLESSDVRLPAGDRLTWRRFRQAGLMLGMSDGAQRLHYLLELEPSSPAFLHDAAEIGSWARNPLYALLQEACWADGGATHWAAERALPAAFHSSDLLTGEHVYPWMFEDYAALAPLGEAAGLLAERDWSRLYDPEVLERNQVPVAAAVYSEDMYVERAFSEETAARIRGARVWLTNEYDHNGLRVDGGRILGRLIDLARDRA